MKYLIFIIGLLWSQSLYAQDYRITDFGAKGDGKTINTKAIQRAIDKAAQTGGRVVVPAGVFTSGALELKDHSSLYIEKNGVLKGVADVAAYPAISVDYPLRNMPLPWNAHALLFAKHCNDITLSGEGSIDGNGADPVFAEKAPGHATRPYGLFFVSCRNINVSGLYLTNSGMWMQHYLNCDVLRIKDLRVFNHANLNNDGMDVDDCRNVIISDCMIDSDDDALCFKSEGDGGIKNVVVTNCVLSSHASAFKFGTGSIGGFESVQFANSVIRPSRATNLMHPFKKKGGIDGIDLASVDGAVMKNINISGITIDSVLTPIFIRLGKRLDRSPQTPKDKQGVAENIQISQVIIKNAGATTSSITAYPGAYVHNITLRDIVLEHNGGGTVKDTSLNVPDRAEWYPVATMFGRPLPAFGFYIRHVDGLYMQNIRMHLAGADARPSIVLDDARQISLNAVTKANNSDEPLKLTIANSNNVRIDEWPDAAINVRTIQSADVQINHKNLYGTTK